MQNFIKALIAGSVLVGSTVLTAQTQGPPCKVGIAESIACGSCGDTTCNCISGSACDRAVKIYCSRTWEVESAEAGNIFELQIGRCRTKWDCVASPCSGDPSAACATTNQRLAGNQTALLLPGAVCGNE